MKTLTVSKLWRQSGRQGSVPHVRLTGQWLTRLGFTPGAKLNVRVEGSTLTLEIAR